MTVPIDRERTIAAITAYAEASGGSPAERRCVIWTMFSRMAQPSRFGICIAEICIARYQYSEWNDDKADNANLRRAMRTPVSDAIMLDCAAAYDEVLGSHTRPDADPTRGATHYHEKAMDPFPDWTEGAVATLTTEHFIFYRGVK